jgi:hypothetical protein
MLDAIATGKDLVQVPHRVPECRANVAILISDLRLLGSHGRLILCDLGLKIFFNDLSSGHRRESPRSDEISSEVAFHGYALVAVLQRLDPVLSDPALDW